MPIDIKIAQNLTSTMVEGTFSVIPKADRLVASELFESYAMPTQTINAKMEMPVYELDDSNGRAASGVKSSESIFCDISLTAHPVSAGKIINDADFSNYELPKKVKQFVEATKYMPWAYDERKLSELIVNGKVAKCSYDNQPFFGTHKTIVGEGESSFVNRIDCGLTGVATPSVAQWRTAVSKLIQVLRTVSFGEGWVLDVLDPEALLYSAAAEQGVTDALDAEFIATGNGSQDVRAYKSRYPLKLKSMAYLDAQIALNAANGDPLGLGANAQNILTLVAKPCGQAAGFATGAYEPYSSRSDLPALTSGSMVTAFSTQFAGKIAHGYAFPHFVFQAY